MAESAARRERIDPPVAPNWYLWEVPGKPANVYVSFGVIDRLEHETMETFRSLTSRGSEMGGILLGSVVPGNPAIVNIEDCESIGCDYTRGPLYRLSEADLSRFEKAIEEHSAPGPKQVVGFFRSHTRKGLALDAEDLQFLSARFRNPRSVALLIRPFATRASVAGIFLREENGFSSDASALEFPFRSAQLAASKREPDAPLPSGPLRAQVVPITPRRETPAIPLTPVSREVTEPLATLTLETPAPPVTVHTEPASAEAPLTSTPVPSPSVDKSGEPAPVQSDVAVAPVAATSPNVVEPPPVLSRESAISVPSFGSAEPALLVQPGSPSKVPLLVGLLAAGLLAFVLLFVYPGFVTHRQQAPTSASQDVSPLTLRIEHTGTDLLLTWNRDSAAIRNASRAALSISDGERHEKYDMDIGQLQTGSIVYSPLGGDVSFQMEVTARNGSHTATETLRVLRTRPSPMPEQAQQAKNEKLNGSLTPPGPEAATAAADSSNPGSVSPEPEPVRPPAPVRPFDTSSLAARLRPAQSADLTDLPRPVTDTVAPRINPEGALTFGSVPAPAAPAPAPSARGAAQSNPSVGGKIQGAQLISRREPEYPPLARQMGAKGVVELMATIGTDGSVKSVKIISGHPLLVKAAQDAVMHWRYRPTMLNGVAVQNDTRITLNFVPQQ